MRRTLGLFCLVWLVAASAHADPAIRNVDHVSIPVSDVARAARFYETALNFEADEGTASPAVVLRLGKETIELHAAAGRPYPADSRSNDRWFQHLAIVVSDIDRAYSQVTQAGAKPISPAPQTLPAWNPNAGGIKAVYFRDPDGHPLELIQFPPGKGDPRWQSKASLFLGIDHTAIGIAGTDASLGFYRDRLGFHVVSGSDNYGIEQEHLSGVAGAHVRITGLRADSGPGIEFLEYLAPRDGRPMPADTKPDDLWADEIVMVARAPLAGEKLRDPDGHAITIIGPSKERSQ